jgi:hypothetical protein
MEWLTQDYEAMNRPPGQCAACGVTLPGDRPFISGVGGLGTTYDQTDAFGTAFGTGDNLLDCWFCWECLRN